MNSVKKILLVEDEPQLGIVVKEQLIKEGYYVDLATDGIQAGHFFKDNMYDIVLLDVQVPYKNGLVLCREFRLANEDVAILMLTAVNEIENKVEAFDLGADDYLVKPFHFDELFSRVKALIKRNKASKANEVTQLEIDDYLIINYKDKSVYVNNQEISLTAKEYGLLLLLAKNRGNVISKQEILEKVWNLTFDTGTNTIEVYINFLRNKLEKPFNKKLIFTKPGFGYYIK